MRESFTIDRKKLYGFDYGNNEAAAWAQNEAETLFEEEAAEVEMDEAAEEAKEEILEEVSAKEAFFEFARGIPVRPPHQQHRPPQSHPPRVPHHPSVPPHPGPGHDFNPNSGSAPRFAPPSHVPQRAPGLRAVDPGAISRCLYSNTYVWLNNGQHFWFFPTFIGRKSIAGYRWMHRHWVFMGFGLNMIDSFFCSR